MTPIISHRVCKINCLLFLIASFFYPGIQVYASELTVAVANSTCKTIKEVGVLYTQQHDIKINYICKSSGRLAKGLRGGAITADIYISANRTWMDYMLKHKLASKQNVISPWGNSLVIATNQTSNIEIKDLTALTDAQIKTILIGDPGTAPFGRYAKEALKSTKMWEQVKTKIVSKKHITLLANTLAKSDDSTIGILFLSNSTKEHKVVYYLNKSSHSPIHYYLAPFDKASNHSQLAHFIDFLKKPLSQKIFLEAGFNINTD